MRVPFIVCALMLACGAVVLAADESTNSTMPCPNPSGQAMVDACLSRCLSVSRTQIADLRAKGLTDADIAIAAAIAAKACKPIADVVAQWQSSKDWKQVAGGYNLSMADLVSAPVAAGADSEAFNTAFLAQYYNASQAPIAQIRRQGYSWDDINVFANAALATKQSIGQIASLRSQGTSWADIASRYNVSYDALTSPAKVRSVAVTPPSPTPSPAPSPTTSGAGPLTSTVCPPCSNGPCLVCNSAGHVVLTYDQVIDLYAAGYDWLDVAIATNIAMYTGYPIRQVLTDLKGHGTWQLTLPYYGVSEAQAFNVADFPFPRRSIYSMGLDAENQQRIVRYQKPGTWPTCPKGSTPCPGGVGPPCPITPAPCPTTPPSPTTEPSGTTRGS